MCILSSLLHFWARGMMGVGWFAYLPAVSLLFRSSLCQQPNTDLFSVSYFLQHMGLSSYRLNSSASVCSWQGVFCDSSLKHVDGLVLSDMGLSGTIPDSTIGKLGKLQFLDLSSNKITGLPADFWSLGSLKSLNLSGNQVSGNLPSNIGNFVLLQTLDLSCNNFSGEIPATISSLVSLQVLKLNHNKLESGIPSSIQNCQSLVSVDLSLNRLAGLLPHGFLAAFPKLKTLSLAGNAIQGSDSDFLGLQSITNLNISKNLFNGSVLGVFQHPLEAIDLSFNRFDGNIHETNLSSSFNWSGLVYLDLSDNLLNGVIFPNLHQFRSIRHLNLANNKFSEQSFPHIGMLRGLQHLNLSRTSLWDTIPTDTSQLSSLNVLDLSHNNLSGKVPSINAKKLQTLDVSSNNLSGQIPSSIMRKLSFMERYNFSYNHFTLCGSESEIPSNIFKAAFIGSLNSCPIAANSSDFQKRVTKQHKGLKLSLALALLIASLLTVLLFLAIGFRMTRMGVVKPPHKEEQTVSGPFSFQTDSTTWVADVKHARTVPVVLFEKPLLNFTFADLLYATSNFDRGTLLADGRFGPVYRGFLPGGTHVAIKVLVHGSILTDEEAMKELEHLGRVKHPNLVPLIGYCLAGEQRIAIYDYMENGNLQGLLHDMPLGVQATEDWSTDAWEEDQDGSSHGITRVGSERSLDTWSFRHRIALGTARALAFLHHGCSPPIIHRDVRGSSIFLDANFEPRLSDSGLAKIFVDGLFDEESLGVPGYIPSELSDAGNEAATPKSDVFGFGVILLELVTGKKPVGDEYPERKEGNLVSWVRGLVRSNEGLGAVDPRLRGTGWDAEMEEAVKIGYFCTAELPAKRPTMQQIVGLLKDIEPAAHQ